LQSQLFYSAACLQTAVLIERTHTRRLAEDEEPGGTCRQAGGGRGLVEMKTAQPPSVTIRQIEFELEKAEYGLAMPYDAERVGQLRKMLVEARKRRLSEGLARRRRHNMIRRDPTSSCKSLSLRVVTVSPFFVDGIYKRQL
jgi:hypothetical protein